VYYDIVRITSQDIVFILSHYGEVFNIEVIG